MITLPRLNQSLLLLLLFWMIFEGAFRRWFLPGLSNVLFLGKWVICLMLYFFYYFLSGRLKISFRYPYQIFIFLYFTWSFLTIFLNEHPNPWDVYIIGLFVHLIYIPLIGIVPEYLDFNKFQKGIVWFSKITLPLVILSMFQFYLPHDHILNKFINEEQLITRTGLGFTRVTSVFTFVKLYNVYLLFYTTIITAYLFYLIRNRMPYMFHLAVWAMAIISTFMTGSRLSLFLTFFNIALIAFYVFTVYANMRYYVSIGMIIMPAVFIVLYNTTDIARNAVDSFMVRFQRAGAKYKTEEGAYIDVYNRSVDRLDFLKYATLTGLQGWGVGVAYQGNDKRLKSRFPEYYEEEGERLSIDLGLVGITIVVLMRIFIFFHSLNVWYATRHPLLKIILYAMTIYQIPHVLLLSNTVYNYMDNFVYWFNFALILAMAKNAPTNEV